MAFLERSGFVDDKAFAHFWKESRRRLGPRSVAMIRNELRRLGIARDVIDDTVSDMDDDKEACRAVGMITNRVKGSDYLSFNKKAGGYLRRRGFSYAIIKDTVDKAWDALANSVNGYEHGNHQKDQSKDVPC